MIFILLVLISHQHVIADEIRQKQLVNQVVKREKISDRIAQVMSRVDRANFVSISPYSDSPASIGYGVTISAPHMHAYALKYLENSLHPGAKVLDIGSGSGYLTLCFLYMLESEGEVYGVEHVP